MKMIGETVSKEGWVYTGALLALRFARIIRRFTRYVGTILKGFDVSFDDFLHMWLEIAAEWDSLFNPSVPNFLLIFSSEPLTAVCKKASDKPRWIGFRPELNVFGSLVPQILKQPSDGEEASTNFEKALLLLCEVFHLSRLCTLQSVNVPLLLESTGVMKHS